MKVEQDNWIAPGVLHSQNMMNVRIRLSGNSNCAFDPRNQSSDGRFIQNDRCRGLERDILQNSCLWKDGRQKHYRLMPALASTTRVADKLALPLCLQEHGFVSPKNPNHEPILAAIVEAGKPVIKQYTLLQLALSTREANA